MTIKLSELALGQAAKVVRVEVADEVGQRLLEMGLLPGTAVSLVGIAPMGDPLAFELRGYRLSLRRSEAARVEAERV